MKHPVSTGGEDPVASHVVHTEGRLRFPRPVARGGLAPWQERLAKELLSTNVPGHIFLSDLASACDLSIRHFTRAFRQSTGMAPHRWLVHLRLEKAKALLAYSLRSLAEIARDCGFADQSHFTRVFLRTLGVTPGHWRKKSRGR